MGYPRGEDFLPSSRASCNPDSFLPEAAQNGGESCHEAFREIEYLSRLYKPKIRGAEKTHKEGA
jgi:hypothetical protein